MNWLKSLWGKLTSASTLKTGARLLGAAAVVSTNPAVAAKLALGAKAMDIVADVPPADPVDNEKTPE